MPKLRLSSHQFQHWFSKLPLARQYELQRAFGFSVFDDHHARLQVAAATRAGLSADATPAQIIYTLSTRTIRGLRGLGRPSVRLEFKDNEGLMEFMQSYKGEAKVATSRPASVRKQEPEKPDSSFWQEIKNLARQTTEALTVPASLPEPERPAAPVTDLAPDKGSDLVQWIPLTDIHTSHKLFQNRKAEFSQESVDRIIEAVDTGIFEWEVFDPILLWRNPEDGLLYVLSGHSRFEAFKRLAEPTTYKGQTTFRRYRGDKSFNRIPAKITLVSLKEAQEIARNSNNLGTRETDLERATYYRNKLQQGATFKDLEPMAKNQEGKNAKYILNLAALNPAGRAWQALELFEGTGETDDKKRLQTLSDWTGEARRRWPDLTDSHENEIWEWLPSVQGTKAGQLRTKSEFIARLQTVLDRRRNFDQLEEGPLNLLNRMQKSSVEMEYDQQLDTAKRAYEQAKKDLDDKRKELVSREATPEQLSRILPAYEVAVTARLKELNQLAEQRGNVKEYAKSQASLFGVKGYNWKKVMDGAEVARELERNGWELDRVSGSHYIYVKSGHICVVPFHGKKGLSIGTLTSIKKTVAFVESL
jgi:predicted RNA binding protein YcfA (HicA-like mRNA interferase family)